MPRLALPAAAVSVVLLLAGCSGDTPSGTLARFRGVVDSRTAPSGHVDAWLGEIVVHGEDIRRPLGIPRDYPTETVVRALAHQLRTSVGLGGGKQRAAGVRHATDDDIAKVQ